MAITIVVVMVIGNVMVPTNVMVMVSTLIGLSIEFNFIRLHDFLYGGTYISEPHINSGFFDSCVRRIFDGGQQIVVFRIERHRKRTIDDSTVDMCAEVNLHHIGFLQHRLHAHNNNGVVRSHHQYHPHLHHQYHPHHQYYLHRQ